MDRRQLLKAGLALPFALSGGKAVAKDPIYIGDMHYHLLFIGPNPASTQPLAKNMAAGNATLVSWSLIGDLPWMTVTPRGFKQKGAPRAGETVSWLEKEMARVKAHLAEQNLKIVKTAEDVDLALKGEPHVVLSVEGASFLDEGVSQQLQAAYDMGIRHIQLVHYIRNSIGDFQTEKPEHGGLTEAGKKAVHSSVTKVRTPQWTMPVTQARQLTLERAKAIAAKGGVVGLWAVRSDAGATPEAYGDKLWEMADWLGEDHVAFGTDMNGLISPLLRNYSDVRRVVAHLERKPNGEARVRKLAIENYARVLRQAFAARQA
jgi:membrane dipeptidase